MRVAESIKELRRICQYTRDSDYGGRPWPERNLTRPLSIYITKFFLILGVSANQAGLIGLIITIIGGALMISPNPSYWLIGIILLLLCEVIGAVDGEIARYTRSASTRGAFWNAIPEQFVALYTPICMAFGLYNLFHSVYPLIIGFIAVISISVSTFTILLPYPILRDKGLLAGAISGDKAVREGGDTGLIIKYGHFFNHFTIFLIIFLIGTIVDCFVSPFTIGTLSFNIRYILFALYTLVWLLSAIRNIYLPLRAGVSL